MLCYDMCFRFSCPFLSYFFPLFFPHVLSSFKIARLIIHVRSLPPSFLSLCMFYFPNVLPSFPPSLPLSFAPPPSPSDHALPDYKNPFLPPFLSCSLPTSLPTLLPLWHHLQRMFFPPSLPPSSLPSRSSPPVRIIVLCLLLPLTGRHGYSRVRGGNARACRFLGRKLYIQATETATHSLLCLPVLDREGIQRPMKETQQQQRCLRGVEKPN